MKKRNYLKEIVGIGLFFILWLCSINALAEEKVNPLKMKIALDKESYRIGQTMFIKVEIINTSSKEYCFMTSFYVSLKLLYNGKSYELTDCERAESFDQFAPPPPMILTLAANSSVSKILLARFFSKDYDLLMADGPFHVFAEMPLDLGCPQEKRQFGTLVSDKINVEMQPLPEKEKEAWSEMVNTKIKAHSVSVSLVNFLPHVSHGGELEEGQAALLKSFIQKYPRSYYADKLKLTLAIDKIHKKDLKGVEEALASCTVHDHEYYLTKLKFVQYIYRFPLTDSEKIIKAHQILDEVSKTPQTGVLSEVMGKKVEEFNRRVKHWEEEKINKSK